MRTHISLLRHPDQVDELLRADGWRLEVTSERSRLAQHDHVETEADARTRLYRLGLLTSTAVQLDFLIGAN